MSNPVLLNSNTHKDVRIVPGRGEEFGENVHIIPVVADELKGLVYDYPVAMIKNKESGKFELFAVTGFDQNENLFLEGDKWDARYLPVHVGRQPFMVALTEATEDKPEGTVITIDMDSKRIREGGDEGLALFDDKGEQTDYLKSVVELMSTLIPRIQVTEKMLEYLAEKELVEQVNLSVKLKDGEPKNFTGLYTVKEESIKNLDAETLKEMNDRGYLFASHLLLASMGNFQKLIDKKNSLSA